MRPKLAANYDLDWPGITAMLAVWDGYMQGFYMKKFFAILICACLCFFTLQLATAEAVLTKFVDENNAVSASGGNAESSLSSSYYDDDDYYPNRGETVNLWWWYDTSKGYNLKDGKSLNHFYYDYYGRITVKVTQGSSWLGLRGTADDWEWAYSYNTTTKTRKGQITITDSRGTVLTINISQAGKPSIKKIKRINSKKTNKLSINKIKDVDGYVIYRAVTKSDYAYYYEYSEIDQIKNSSTYSDKKCDKGYYYSYKIAPYKIINGKTIIGTTTDVVTVDLR